jgi:hypothetical protein
MLLRHAARDSARAAHERRHRSCRYEPGVQRTYDELAENYGTAILPARPMYSRDKAKVEIGAPIAQRWILARLRHHTFFSLEELNERMADLVEDLNNRTMRVYRESRRRLFERIERATLQRLPATLVHVRSLEARCNGEHRLPRRLREPLLLCAPRD